MSPSPATSPRAALATLAAELAGALRGQGLVVDPASVAACAEAWAFLGDTLNGLYWGARQTMVRSVGEFPAFDAGFAAFLGWTTPADDDADAVPTPIPTVHVAGDEVGGRLASRGERLAGQDIATCDEAERRDIFRSIAELRLTAPRRVGVRQVGARRGHLDLRATVRRSARFEGDLIELAWRRQRRRARRVVLLVDVSASMADYAEVLLRFGHVAVRAVGAEVFAMGTRLTRLTPLLDCDRPDEAVARINQRLVDRDGGTRLGASLECFTQQWGARGLLRGAIVVIGSDGWERDDPALLGRQMAEVARRARRVVWVNPHCGRSGFEPTAAGMAAAMPHCDALVDGANLTGIRRLNRVVAAAMAA